MSSSANPNCARSTPLHSAGLKMADTQDSIKFVKEYCVYSPLAAFSVALKVHWDCLVTGVFVKLCHALGGLYM